jgi:hypothetical protein
MINRKILLLLALMIPQTKPITDPAIKLKPETATVIQSPLRKNGRLCSSSAK